MYSLGNLVFGGTHEMKTFDAILAQATLRFDADGGYTGADIRIIPVLTSGSAPKNDFRPVLASGGDAERIVALVRADSAVAVAETMWFDAKGEQALARSGSK